VEPGAIYEPDDTHILKNMTRPMNHQDHIEPLLTRNNAIMEAY